MMLWLTYLLLRLLNIYIVCSLVLSCFHIYSSTSLLLVRVFIRRLTFILFMFLVALFICKQFAKNSGQHYGQLCV